MLRTGKFNKKLKKREIYRPYYMAQIWVFKDHYY